MKVKLPRTCTGDEIVHALLAACQKQAAIATSDRRLESLEIIGDDLTYVPGSVKRETPSKGILIFRHKLNTKNWFIRILKGSIAWTATFELKPIQLNHSLNEIELSLNIDGWGGSAAQSPVNHQYFREVSPDFEQLLLEFYKILGTVPTTKPT